MDKNTKENPQFIKVIFHFSEIIDGEDSAKIHDILEESLSCPNVNLKTAEADFVKNGFVLKKYLDLLKEAGLPIEEEKTEIVDSTVKIQSCTPYFALILVIIILIVASCIKQKIT